MGMLHLHIDIFLTDIIGYDPLNLYPKKINPRYATANCIEKHEKKI